MVPLTFLTQQKHLILQFHDLSFLLVYNEVRLRFFGAEIKVQNNWLEIFIQRLWSCTKSLVVVLEKLLIWTHSYVVYELRTEKLWEVIRCTVCQLSRMTLHRNWDSVLTAIHKVLHVISLFRLASRSNRWRSSWCLRWRSKLWLLTWLLLLILLSQCCVSSCLRRWWLYCWRCTGLRQFLS